MKKKLKNHKVKSVRFLDVKEDVYDITVEDNHNFALSAGVFVHNSKDAIDSVVGALWNASKNGDEFAYNYGENIDLSIGISESKPTLTQEDINAVFEKELMRLNDPMSKFKQDSNRNKNNNNSNFTDFGMGIAQPVQTAFGSDGIFVW